MSVNNPLQQQLQQDLQNELMTTNQLLQQISIELQKIKHMTKPGGEFEENIKENATLIAALAKIQQVNLDNLPPMQRKQTDISHHASHNISYEPHDSLRNTTSLEDSQ